MSVAENSSIGVALSGGGFRASMWALGSLLYLEDAGVASRVSAISSVSGGSITNGLVAAQTDYGDGEPLRPAVAPLVKLAADDGLVLFGRATNGYVRVVLTVASLALAALVSVVQVAVFAVVHAFAGLFERHPFGDGLVSTWQLGVSAVAAFGWSSSRVRRRAGGFDRATHAILWVGMVAGATLVIAALAGRWTAFANGVAVPALILVSIGLVGLGLWMFGLRSHRVERGLTKTLYSGKNGDPVQLGELRRRRILHVICATELQSGIHAYFSPRFVYSYRFGHGALDALPLARAVQASAALPGGFAPRRIDTPGFAAPTKVPAEERAQAGDPMVLLDGGVYDNMGVAWFVGLDQRRDTWDGEGWPSGELRQTPGHLLVVNASVGWVWRPLTKVGVRNEIPALLRVQEVMYKTTTRPLRRHLIREWQLLDRGKLSGMRGAIINIDQSPWRLAQSLVGSRRWGSAARRAIAALKVLETAGGPGEDEWTGIASANAAVTTVLNALDRTIVQRLLWHAYVLTAVAAHIFVGVLLPARLPTADELLTITATADPILNDPMWITGGGP